MRGLPPPPDFAIEVLTTFDVAGRPATIRNWVLPLGAAFVDVPMLNYVSSQYVLAVGPALANCCSDSTQLSTCRASVYRPLPRRFVSQFPTVHGRATGWQFGVVASGVYVMSSIGGRGSGSRIRIPDCPLDFLGSAWQLNQTGVSYLTALCTAYVNWIGGMSYVGVSSFALGTVRRARGGVPLAAATFDQAVAVEPSLRLEYIGRRKPSAGLLSP